VARKSKVGIIREYLSSSEEVKRIKKGKEEAATREAFDFARIYKECEKVIDKILELCGEGEKK